MVFPNFAGKHSEDSMISPDEYRHYLKRIGGYPERTPPRWVILCYQNRLLRFIQDNHATTEVRSPAGEMHLRSMIPKAASPSSDDSESARRWW